MHRRFCFLYAAEVCAKMVQHGTLLLNGPEHWTFRLVCSSSLVRMSNFKTLLFIFIQETKQDFPLEAYIFQKNVLDILDAGVFPGTMTS